MSVESAVRAAVEGVIVPAYESGEFTCTTWPWQLLGTDYGDAWSPTHPTGRQAATENRSRLVDVIPDPSRTFMPRGRVEETYGQVLAYAHAKAAAGRHVEPEAACAAAIGAVQAEVAARSQAPGPDGKPVLVLTEAAKGAAETKRKAADAAALRHVQDAIGKRSAALAQGPAPTPPATRVADTLDIPSVDAAFYQARQMFEMSRLQSAASPTISYHASYLLPDNVTDKDAAGDWPFATLPLADGAAGLELTVRFTRVDILRPWFLLSLFDLPGWQTNQPAGSLSSGNAAGNTGAFPLLPLSLIVARDIRAARGGEILFQASGLQIVAWINRVMPFSPH